jgi:hypothetical protein
MVRAKRDGWAFLINIHSTPEAGMVESRLKSEDIPVLRKSKGSGAVTKCID